ncbi:sialate O-acetylesterase [Desertivirga brevis]|uniref:sialate O-acetylesterase n=1 Tax=Desertivirga brevis TaxID=2810310 RepID=UPI001A9677C1|nr:sialate O-acetylesterase [Pedobacter sp. SYSU D00873]
MNTPFIYQAGRERRPGLQLRLPLKKGIILLSALLLNAFYADANVRLPKLFGDGMVLQRNQNIPVWGWADKGEKVTVTFRGQSKTVKADNSGKWKVELSPEAAGGPFKLHVKGKNAISLNDVLVGEVWLCSGQSNMEWSVRGSKDAEKEIREGKYPLIRHFKVPNTTAKDPQNDIRGGSWVAASPNTVGDFTAVGYFFARELYKELQVPIGLINSSWGGTDIETWISRSALQNSDIFKAMMRTMPASADLEYVIKERKNQLNKRIVELQGSFPKDSAAAAIFRLADFDDSKWPKVKVPGFWEQSVENLDGIAWLRTSFNIKPENAGKPAELHLAMIDDSDETYVNGTKVGSVKNGYNTNRVYNVPAGVLKAGKNVISVRVEDTGGGGGIYGSANDVKIQMDNETIPLEGQWKFQLESLLSVANSNSMSDPNSFPTLLYNGMIHPLIPYAIKGALWYQGENNAGRAVQYRDAFPLMINDWRSKWNQGNFPFYFVQLSSWIASSGDSNHGSSWAELREAQTQTLKLPNTGMAVTIDIGETNDIHPKNKQDVGKRLAAVALNQSYKKGGTFKGPAFEKLEISGNKAVLNFTETGSGLMAKDKYGYLRGFEIAGADQKFYYAKGYVEGNKVILSSDQVSAPVAVRYAWADDAGDANLFNKEGFPAVPFRTDNWKPITENVKYTLR